MQRLALVTAYEALEMAGFAPNRTPSTTLKRIGTFYGQASDDWREVNAGQIISTYGVPGGERAFGNGRINYFFKFGGPSFNLDTACSSGLAAVNAACSALWAGEADTVLAGGLNVITNPDIYCMLSKGHFLSKTGQCKVWDEDADGYCRADGIGSVVIKRLEDAEADNDNIIATIVAGTTNHSGEAISITHPHAGAQKDNYQQVMQTAGVNPLDVSYIELHGTGTQAGDAVESESVADVFAPITRPRRPDQRLHLGAVKSNIGHGEAAAGIASLIKVLLTFQKNQIPRHIGIKTTINPVVAKNMEKRNAGLAMENTPWPRLEKKKRYAVVNSFGAHGGNTTLLLEDAPEKVRIGTDPRAAYVVALSAKSKVSLRGNIEALISYLDRNPDINLGDLSYTTCARRIHHHTRIATSVTDITQLRKFLESSIENAINLRPVPAIAPAVAFAFTGQGAFYDGAGSQLFRDSPSFRKEVAQLDRIVQKLGFPSVIPAIEGADGAASSPLVTQLTILVLEIALVKFWELLGVKPSVVIGHSLGEYAAIFAAGVISAADAIFLIGKRAELILATCRVSSHVMLSVRESVAVIKKFAGNHSFEVSCLNGQTDTVISGPQADIEAIRAALESNGLKCLQLDIPFAFHSAQLDPMLDSFERIAKHISFKLPSVAIVSPLLGKCIFDGKTINAKYLCRASREPVNFVGALEAARNIGIIDERTVWIDNGPHPLCSAFIRSHNLNAKVFPSLRRNESSHVTIQGTLAKLYTEGLPICWNEYFRPYEKAYNLLHLSHYKWNEKDYWVPYVGTWTLDKAQSGKDMPKSALRTLASCGSSLKSSSVQQIISEDIHDITGSLTAVSDIMRSDLLDAVKGHLMRGHGVVSAVGFSLLAVHPSTCILMPISLSGPTWL
jgi:acyl transferase domain-containing protein